MKRNQIFISYSHADAEHLQRLRVHLRPFERDGLVEVWADTRIRPGQRWRQEIGSALERAAVSILLVSADFLASDFIADNELPPLLKAAQEKGLKILPVVLKPCAFLELDELSQFQAFNDPNLPLINLAEGEREKLWHTIAVTVRNELAAAKPREHAESVSSGVASDPAAGEQKLQKKLDPKHYWGMFGEELLNPHVVEDFIVYQYQHLDDYTFMPDARLVLGDFEGYEELAERVAQRFRRAGWEGDGTLTLMWFPPFVGAGIEDTHGLGVWHVKQSNNGTSWIASPIPLPFARLLGQNS